MENIKITFNPKQENLKEIEDWMVEEKKIPITENGNWESIIYAFENKKLVIATQKGKTVGFYTLSFYKYAISIGVAEVNPNYRNKGIGKLLLDKIIEKYSAKDIYALHLFCAPESSQKIWKKLKFKYYPNNSSNTRSQKIEMYRIIKTNLNCSNKIENEIDEVIEIWNDEPYKTEKVQPTWIWKIKYLKNSSVLKNPIVHFGHHKWRIRWRKGETIYKDCKYSYFDNKNEEFSCIVIKETKK